MAILRSTLCLCTCAALLGHTFAAGNDQVFISSEERSKSWRVSPNSGTKLIKYNGPNGRYIMSTPGEKIALHGDKDFHKADGGNDGAIARFMTYDDFWPSEDWPNSTYSNDFDGYLNFNQFNVMFASQASEEGFINKRDVDCAVSQPIALYNTPSKYSTPSVIQSNATGLAAAGLSEYFDVIAWSWKPMGPYPEDLPDPILVLDLYRIEGNKTFEWIAGAGSGWDGELEYFEPLTFVPQEIVYGDWGVGVNWMEFRTLFWDDDTSLGRKSFDFCVDNVVLLFHKKEK